MRLNSDYRIFTLKAVAYFIVLPVDQRSLTVLISTFPVLENGEEFIRACQKLQMKGLVKFLNLFDETGKKMDAVSITSAGLKCLKSIGFDPTVGREYRYTKGRNFETKILILKQNQIEILAHSGIDLNEHGGKLLTRDDIIQNIIKIDQWQHYLQFKASRVNAVLICSDEYIPIYNVLNKNIIINPKSEMGFAKGIAEVTRIPQSKKTILFSPSAKILEKTVMTESIPFDRKRPSSLGKQSIYSKYDLNKSINQYLLINSPEQALLLPLFSFWNVEKYFTIVAEVYFEDEMAINSTVESDYSAYPSLLYESDEEVGVQIILQNMYTLQRLYDICEKRKEGRSKDNRRLAIYGLSANREVYEYLFSKFEFVVFRSIDTETFLEIIRGDDENEQK